MTKHPAAILLLSAALASPAAADWLVTKEGAKVETQGPWKVKGKLVVFKTADGKLASLRVADVDLDASRNATEEAVAAQAQAASEPEKPAPERKKSVRVITDKDVRQAAPPAAPGSPEAAAPGPTTGPGVLVDTWTQDRDAEDGHVVINGSLQNASGATAVDLQLRVMLYDDSGTLMATSQAAIGSQALPPGEKITFRADFPGYFSFATLKFEPQGRRLATRPAGQPIPETPPEGGGEGGGA
ncbi:MAG: FxLYD domain-containing protein [Acidobacteriota bacterium]